MRRFIALVGLGLALAGCTRPVDRPADGDKLINDVKVSPEFVRANVPIEISFISNGRPLDTVTYELAGETFPCTPERLTSGRLACTHPAVPDNSISGQATVVVNASGDGRTSSATGTYHVDLDCPTLISATLSQTIAEPGQKVSLTMEASEILDSAPIVTRLGRSWGTAVGSGTSWVLNHDVTTEDPSQFADLVVRVRDRAGNTSGDCGQDRLVPFAVDQEAPVANVAGVILERSTPDQPATLAADPGSFIDDVGIARVRVHDATTGTQIASLEVDANGGIPEQSLGGPTSSRVLVQAVDQFGRESAKQSVRERWRVSVGSGSTPGAAVKTAVRYSPAPPTTTSMRNRTVELAPDILQEDARTTVIRAVVGFEKVGELPTRYENAKRVIAGYDPTGKAMVAVGGYNGPDLARFNFYDGYMSDVQVVRWDEREGIYIPEQGPLLSYQDASVPDPRYGLKIDFDEQGCGVMFGGDLRVADTQTAAGNDLWRICFSPGGYTWSRINLPSEVDGQCVRNYAPIVWDHFNQRFIMAGDGEYPCGDTRVLFLEPGQGTEGWRWVNVQPLPTTFQWHDNGALFVDPDHGGFVVGLGTDTRLIWTYRNGQWTAAQVPSALTHRYRAAWGYDSSRRQLVVWGGNTFPGSEEVYPEPQVWYLTDTSTNGPEAWRSTLLDNPPVREYHTMVYDSDREVMLVFGGVNWQEARTIPPDLYQLVSQPSFPQMQVVADLGAARPKGIERLLLKVRAQGSGDADGVRPGVLRGGGVRVSLWDHDARAWVEMHAAARDHQAGFETVELSITQNPERFVSPTGTVPITVTSYRPATEVLEGRLEVDVVDGTLDLRPGVTLP